MEWQNHTPKDAKRLVDHLGPKTIIDEIQRKPDLTIAVKNAIDNLHYSQLTFRLYGYQYGSAKKFINEAKTYYSDNGILTSLNIPLNEGQLLENFVISEFEKRRKLGIIQCDRLYYYKSAAGREIDLIIEGKDEIYAIEIKNTLRPSERDIRNLVQFSRSMKKKVKMFLFYPGEEYDSIKEVQIVPVSGLYRGQ